VTQEITHGPEQSRNAAFAQGTAEEFLVLHCLHTGFRDRRIEGRRYRQTDNVSELDGPQQPYEIAGLQSEHNTMDRLTMRRI
jgi:hypothetical protein